MTRLSPALRLRLLQSVYTFQVVLLNARPMLISAARQFPEQVFDATVLLALELRRQGYVDLAVRTLTDPLAEAPPTQVWLQVEGLHLDWIPAEHPLQPLRLTAQRPPQAGTAVGWQWAWPEKLPAAIQADDAQLQAMVKDVNLDRRTSPFREVEDHWRGIEVLTCGHFAASNGLLGNRKRRCSFCESVLPAKVFRAVTGHSEALDWFGTLTDEERGTAISALYAADNNEVSGEHAAGLDLSAEGSAR